jgi:hypothetical protein
MKHERSRSKGVAREGRCPRRAQDTIMKMIGDSKEIRLALTRAGIATCSEKCIQLATYSAYRPSAVLSRHSISITTYINVKE